MTQYTVGSIKPQQHSALYWMFSDAFIFIKRSLLHIVRHMDQLMGIAIQPIMFMLLFRYVFGGAIDTGTSYVNFLTAGILVQMAAFGASTTSFSVAMDMKRGLIDRIKSLPIASWGLLMGHVIADLVRNLISSCILIGVAVIVGFRPTASPVEWLMIIGILLTFTFAISWVSAILGLLAGSVEAVQWISFLVIFPLTFASAAFAPTDSMVPALRFFAENQPVTHVIEAIRALMIGTPIENHATIAIIWCLAITAVAMPIATHLFRRYTGK